MPKTPPVVIPVIVDASGVDRGIADANRRLRYGTRGMAGTPSGFGSGGGALAQGGGGGGFGGIAAGAIAGAVAGRVARSDFERPTRNLLISRRRQTIAEGLEELNVRRSNRVSKLLDDLGTRLSMSIPGTGPLNRVVRSGMASTLLSASVATGTIGNVVGDIRRRFTSREATTGTRRGLFNRVGQAIPSNIGGRMNSALGILGLGGRFGALGAAGIPFAIAGGMVNYQDRMRQSFQDLTPFEGTLNYNAARRIRAYYNAPERRQPGFFQEFALGAEMNQTGGGTSLLGAYSTTVSEILRSMARTAGGLITSPIDTIMNTFDLQSEFQQRNQQAFTNITDEWKRIFY